MAGIADDNSSVEISHNMEGEIHTYVMKHERGKNYSLSQTVLELIYRYFWKMYWVEGFEYYTIIQISN